MSLRHHLNSFGAGSGQDRIRSHVLSYGLTYGVTDRLALSLDIPLVVSRYIGNAPHQHPGAKELIDDGHYHPVWQDFRAEARYNAVRDPVVLTPFFTVVLPSHHYSIFGHNAPGRDLREYHVGFNLGRQLRPFLPRAYADLRYDYAFVQNIGDINMDRSNVSLEAGYFLKPSLAVRAFAEVRKTHGGLEFGTGALNMLSMEYFLMHDRFWRAHHTRMGGGAVFAVTRSVDMHLAFVKTLSGKNSELSTAIGVGLTWSFSGRREAPASASGSNTAQRWLAGPPPGP